MVVELDRTLPCRDGIPFHRGIGTCVGQTSWTQGTHEGTYGPGRHTRPSAVTAHNGHGGTRAGWYGRSGGGLLSALLLMMLVPRAWEVWLVGAR